jgi:DNA repair protein RadA/Sms
MVHRCGECGAESPRWLGRCTECGAWGSLVETVASRARGAAPLAAPGVGPGPSDLTAIDPVSIREVTVGAVARTSTGVGELDRVLGGGLVPGSVTLLGGEPGMGKSTLLLQALGRLAAGGARCLLVGAEESPQQIRMRAERVGALEPTLLLGGVTTLDAIGAQVDAVEPDVLAVDSIQAVSDPEIGSVPGSVAQVRQCASVLVALAKSRAMPTLLVGHVTKDGALAGPRVLEHLVDTVLSFEGDRHHGLRFLRAVKHRFGATSELGVFEMRGEGLADVPDASALFLADRRVESPGSVVAPVLEGSRPLLVEVQALVASAETPVPRRAASGLDGARLALLLAVLEERAGIGVGRSDVYASVAGGVRIAEPGVDLAVALAVAGTRSHRSLPADTVVVGEVGLGGEIRQVAQVERRLAEAVRLGFARVVGPPSMPSVPGMERVSVATLTDAVSVAYGDRTVRAA